MGTVHIDYRASLRRPIDQERLLDYVSRIARLRHRYHPSHQRMAIFDGPIPGASLIDGTLLLDPPRREREIPHYPTFCRYACEQAAKSLGGDAEVVRDKFGLPFLRVSDLEVRGVEFVLQDWGTQFPANDGRLCVAFVTTPSAPLLDGKMVKVDGVQATGLSSLPFYNQSDQVLWQPSIDLRYGFEKWIDAFFSWLRMFFMPTFSWWHYETLSGYDSFCATLPADMPHPLSQAAEPYREMTFQRLLSDLEAEARWHQRIGVTC